MNDNEIKRLFDYIESRSHKDGVITVEDIKESIGPDLDNDGKVSDKKLYRRSVVSVSKYTGRNIVCYEYSTENDRNGFNPYMVDGKHVSERELCLKSGLNMWLLNFKDEIKIDGVEKNDREITFEEFKKVLKTK